MAASADGFDLVLLDGRVIDPESGLDAVRDVAVADGRIAAVGTGLPAKASRGDIDVAGQVVTAGFIDLHSHVSDWAVCGCRPWTGSPPRWSSRLA